MLFLTVLLANLLIMKLFIKFLVQARVQTIVLGISLIVLPYIAVADIYKHVDQDGKLIKFSDQPQKPGDKPVSVSKPAMVYESKKPASKAEPKRSNVSKKKRIEEQAKPVIGYSAVAIMKPNDDEAIRANNGQITVKLVSQPALDTSSGHSYVIVVDGEKHTQGGSSEIILENMGRGTHSISAEVRDKDDKVLVSSSSKTIHVLRASAAR